VTNGLVRHNHARVERTSHAIKAGDVLTLTLHNQIRVIRVLGLADQRGSAPAAGLLYEELNASQNPTSGIEKTRA
jgi:ribosome-associated heat shock protein Hsp15